MTTGETAPASVPAGPASERIDKWLFFSRIVKSRSLAAKLVSAGHVRVDGVKISQPSRSIKPGETITLIKDARVIVAQILSCGERRGPASEARMLYEDLSPPPEPRPKSALDRLGPERIPGSGRPTKRERRQTDRLRRE